MQHFKHYPFKYNGRKIIGARWYIKGYEAEFGKLNTSDGVEYLSPRDASGHGTHTSSTAAGVLVESTSFKGLAKGSARGGAPSAWLAVYKICGQLEAAALPTFLQHSMMQYLMELRLFRRLSAHILHFLVMLRMCWPLVPSMLLLKEFLLYAPVVILDHMLKLS